MAGTQASKFSDVGRVGEVPAAWLPTLEGVQGSANAVSVTLSARFRIGRAASNDLVLEDDKASRHHAEIVGEGWDWILVDLHSLNGVRVNGTQVVERALLEPGCLIEIGGAQLVFHQPLPDVAADAKRS